MIQKCDVEFEQLIDYVEDSIGPDERAKLESHLALGCSRCWRSVGWLRRVIQLMRTDTSVAPPQWVIERARRLFRQYCTGAFPWPRRMLVFLLCDSGPRLSAVGIRSDGAMVRQVLYGTEEMDIDFLLEEADYGQVDEIIQLAPSPFSPRRMNLSGQILPRGDVQDRNLAYWVTVTRGHERIFAGRTSSLGEFTIDDLLSGKYGFHISLDDDEIVIEGLEV